MRIERRHIGDKGSILMEVLLMIAILIVIFPIIQRNIKERSDSARNELVVKDMMRIKAAVENYLEQGNGETPPCKKNSATDEAAKGKGYICTGGTLSVGIKSINGVDECQCATGSDDCTGKVGCLHYWFDRYGLAPSLKSANIIGQNYSVKIRRTPSGNNSTYDAIIVADGNPDISDMRIREIVDASKGYGGYVEGTVIYGANWSLDNATWTAGANSIIFKAGSLKREYQYITRRSPASNTMHTDLLMNFNNMNSVASITIAGKVEVSGLEVKNSSQTATATEVSLNKSDGGTAPSLLINGPVNSTGTVAFPSGITCLACAIADALGRTAMNKIAVENNMTVQATLSVLNSGITSYLRSVYAGRILAISGGLNLFVGNTISVPQDATVARVANLIVNSAELGNSSGTGVGFTFGKISMCGGTNCANSADTYMVNASTFKGKDIVVRDVNDLFGNVKYGGIDISSKTPISMILRALTYQYADIYRLANGGVSYADAAKPISGIGYNDCKRCYLDPELCPTGDRSLWDTGDNGFCIPPVYEAN
jgi:hypothetical protein